MIQANQKHIGDKKIKNKPGGIAHESRFGGIDRELRTTKVLNVPTVNTSGAVKIEQGWNTQAKQRDVIRITIKGVYAILEREDLEEALAYMAQGDEVIKFTPPSSIKKL